MRLSVALYFAIQYGRAESDVRRKNFESALAKIEKAYKVSGLDKHQVPIYLNVFYCKLAIWTNQMLLAYDLSKVVARQARKLKYRWSEPDARYIKLFSDALSTYCEAWISGHGVDDPNPEYVAFDRSRVTRRVQERFPLKEDGRLR